jgi:hypothetical protein
MRVTSHLSASLVLLAALNFVWAEDVHWTNTLGGNWSQPNNWTPNKVPAQEDNALITEPGDYVVRLDANATVASLTLGAPAGQQTLTNASHQLILTGDSAVGANAIVGLGGGTLGGTCTLSIDGTLIWTGGSMVDTGRTVVAEGGTLVIEGSARKYLDARTVENRGTGTWSGTGELMVNNAGTLENRGTLELQSAVEVIYYHSGEVMRCINHGTLIQNSGSTSSWWANLYNEGTLEVRAGTLAITGPAFSQSAGAFLRGRGTLSLSGATTATTEGTFAPGSPLGTLTIIRDVVLSPDNVVEIELGAARWTRITTDFSWRAIASSTASCG